MDATAVRSLVAAVLAGIAPEADLGRVDDDADLREALDLDSMDFMNLVVALAERTGRDIPEADTPQLRTLRGLQAYLGG
jgi:acyl carrier protein